MYGCGCSSNVPVNQRGSSIRQRREWKTLLIDGSRWLFICRLEHRSNHISVHVHDLCPLASIQQQTSKSSATQLARQSAPRLTAFNGCPKAVSHLTEHEESQECGLSAKEKEEEHLDRAISEEDNEQHYSL